ncbi:immunoglobulin-like domain-containing protein [Bacillus infantis]|uniref:immunoglobulin-like domain-containing protein n=1 Tax=Bacillus infantis TaxID=324767 RepID=UPI00301818E2
MKKAAILLSGLLLLTGCTAQEESISQHDIKIEKVTTEQNKKSKYGELTDFDKNTNVTMRVTIEAIYPSPEYSMLGITNDGDQTYLVSPDYSIEKFIDGVWVEVPLAKESSIDGKTAYLGPGGSYHQKIKAPGDKNIYKSEGKYRLVKVLKSKEKNQEDVILANVTTIGGKN